MSTRRYESRGYLAIDPTAFGMMFFMPPQPAANRDLGVATLVSVRGPLESRAGDGWDSYEAIRDRLVLAFAAAPPVVVLELSSPGGDAAGCFELARWMRGASAAAGKQLIAYVQDKACSAAYALACGATEIVLSASALVGSIGVLSTRADYTARNAREGVAVAFIGSGARKSDGNPDQPITPDELTAQQRIVDSMAAVFFDVVREARGLEAAPLEAGVFHGAQAITVGLADRQLPLDELLVALGGNPMGAMDEARKALQGIADGDGDEKERDAAKRALAAMDEEDKKPEAEGDEPAPKDEDKPKPKPEPDGDEAAYKTAANALSEVHRLRAELAQRDARVERDAIIAARPDLTKDFIAVLQKLPVPTVRELVAKTPRAHASVTAEDALAAGRVKPVLGDMQAAGASQLPPAEKLELDKRMGLTEQHSTVSANSYKLTLGETVSKVRAPGEVNRG
jgi:ClpP class serine protease